MAQYEPIAQTITPSGYRPDEQLFATRFKQGGRTVYSFNLTPAQITGVIKEPDPQEVSPGNRRITASHAQAFARYFIENDKWVVPGLLFRAPDIFTFEPLMEVDGLEFGVVTFAKRRASDIHIVDGQHRTLGFFKVDEEIALEIQKLRDHRTRASRAHDERAVAEATADITRLEQVRKRWATERVSVEIHVVDDLTHARQMFYDIAENALGITNSVKVRFDTRQAVNRALPYVLVHPFLENRVEMNLDRVQRNTPNILSARQVAEIIRVLAVGFDGRISRRMNAELNEEDLARRAEAFFTMITTVFPPLYSLQHGLVTAPQLRETMLLGNPLFLRVLAGVSYELTRNHAWTSANVASFFEKLAPHTAQRAHANSIWKLHAPESTFNENALGPSGRRADSNLLVHTIAGWAMDAAPFVDEAPLAPPTVDVDPDESIDFAPSHSTKALERELNLENEKLAQEAKARRSAN